MQPCHKPPSLHVQQTLTPHTRKCHNDEEDHTRPIKRRVSSKVESPGLGKPLACPFFKKDPSRHWDCANFKAKYSKISHIKQHIYRTHTRPHCCPLCGTAFEHPRLRDEHIRAGCLQSRPFLESDGITIEQRNELNRRSTSKLGVEAQWHAMFKIVCPGSPRPLSPYHSPTLAACEITRDELRRFIASDQVIEAVFKDLPHNMGKNHTAEDRAHLRTALENLIDTWAVSKSNAFTGQNQDKDESVGPFNNTSPSLSHSIAPDTALANHSDPITGDLRGANSPGSLLPLQDLPVISIHNSDQCDASQTTSPRESNKLGKLSAPEEFIHLELDNDLGCLLQKGFESQDSTIHAELATISMGWSFDGFKATGQTQGYSTGADWGQHSESSYQL